jgi:hypothetical protein
VSCRSRRSRGRLTEQAGAVPLALGSAREAGASGGAGGDAMICRCPALKNLTNPAQGVRPSGLASSRAAVRLPRDRADANSHGCREENRGEERPLHLRPPPSTPGVTREQDAQDEKES